MALIDNLQNAASGLQRGAKKAISSAERSIANSVDNAFGNSNTSAPSGIREVVTGQDADGNDVIRKEYIDPPPTNYGATNKRKNSNFKRLGSFALSKGIKAIPYVGVILGKGFDKLSPEQQEKVVLVVFGLTAGMCMCVCGLLFMFAYALPNYYSNNPLQAAEAGLNCASFLAPFGDCNETLFQDSLDAAKYSITP